MTWKDEGARARMAANTFRVQCFQPLSARCRRCTEIHLAIAFVVADAFECGARLRPYCTSKAGHVSTALPDLGSSRQVEARLRLSQPGCGGKQRPIAPHWSQASGRRT